MSHVPFPGQVRAPPSANEQWLPPFRWNFFSPLPNTFLFLPSSPSFSLSLSRTRHTRLILVYIRIKCCFVSRVEICFYYSCDKLFGKKFTLVTRLIHVSISFILCSNIFFLLSKHFQIQLNSYHISMILGLIIINIFFILGRFSIEIYIDSRLNSQIFLIIKDYSNSHSSNNFLANFEKSQ